MDIGKTLGSYGIVDEIGSGGMAIVYRANQPSLGRQVAIKVLSPELARDKVFRERFLREARTIAQLAHPNILPVYDSGQDPETGALYFVMQLVEGGALSQRLGQPMEVEAAVRITAQIARALDYAHKRGLIHRDVKPANVLLTPDGHPLLSDFGIARMMDGTHLTQTGVSLGTPAYMSPEQARGGLVDHRTDIYALGVMIYEMLSGQLPFKSDTPVGMLHQHAFVAPPPLHILRPDLPKSLEKVIMRALAKDPNQRYASAGELADALEGALTGKWQLALPKVTLRPAPRPTPPLGQALAPTAPMAEAQVAMATRSTLSAQPASWPVRLGRGLLKIIAGLIRTVLSIVAFLIVIAIVLTGLGVFIIGALTEQTIVRQDWKLDSMRAGQPYVYSRATFQAGLQAALEPYTLDALTDVQVTFEPPDKIVFSGNLKDTPIWLQVRFDERDDLPHVQIEQLNGAPLYVVGGILSDRINAGLARAWQNAPVRVDTISMNSSAITITYRRR